MKKILMIFAFVFLTVGLVACGGSTDDPTTPVDTDDPTLLPGQIEITYASWDLGSPESEEPNMQRLMIKAFEEAYPNIKVRIIERPKVPGTNDDLGWNEFLAARASTQTLPDVFQADNIPFYVINDWAYNLTTIANADDEYINVSEDIRGVATYDGKVMAIPNAVHYAGYVVNETLYDRQGQNYPEIDTNMTDFLAYTKAAANHASNNNNGVVGLEGIEHIIHWYPAQLNENYRWFTLSDNGFNLNSTEFTTTMELYRTLRTDTTYVLEALYDAAGAEDSQIEIGNIFPEGDPFNNGNILAKWFYSWDFGWIQSNINSGQYTWDLEFIGTPVVNGNKRVPIVADFYTIASNSSHPEEAYLLAKWMGFGKDGYLKRVELSETVPGISQVNFAPIQNDEELLDAYFNLYPNFQGLRTIIETGTFIVEPPKYLPGYIAARYTGTYDAENKMSDILVKLMAGEVALADIRTQLNTRANTLYNEARNSFENALQNK
ncbi:MAG: extracellular solute-binding protein [Acholeplasmataceae bacterium]|nr:extracellular solute-binding protein [Acholeplasmataceae bacterium]